MRLSGSAAREVLAAAPLVSIDLVIEKATGDIVRGLGRKVRIKASRGAAFRGQNFEDISVSRCSSAALHMDGAPVARVVRPGDGPVSRQKSRLK